MADEYSLIDEALKRLWSNNVPENVNHLRPSSRYSEPNTPGEFGVLGPFSERTQFGFQPTRDMQFPPNFDIPPEAYNESAKFTNRAGPLNLQPPAPEPVEPMAPAPAAAASMAPASAAPAPEPRPVTIGPRRAPVPRRSAPAPRRQRAAAPAGNAVAAALWAIYNETGNPADFVRASNAQRMGRADGGYVDPMGAAYEPAGEAPAPDWYNKAADLAARATSAVAEPFMAGTAKSAREGLDMMRGEPGRAPINAAWQYPLGAMGFLTSPIMGAGKAVQNVVTQASGSPDIGARAGFLAEMSNPSKIGPAVAAVLPMASRAAEAARATQVARQLSPLGFYSHGAEVAAALPQAKGTPEQYMAMLQRAGVRPAEMEAVGFQQAFSGRPSVSREEIAKHFQERMPVVEETVLGAQANKYPYSTPDEWQRAISQAERRGNYDEAERLTLGWEEAEGVGALGAPKFQKYTLPGGENYREVLLRAPDTYVDELAKRAGSTAPNATDYRSSHWDEPNVLAHLRMADRTGPGGEKMLHIEEIQSDWGQAGRKEGFNTPEISAQQEKRMQDLTSLASRTPAETAELTQLLQVAGKQSVPSAPYVTSTQGWTDLALKRALREAAEGGYDKMVWTPGAEQAKRYSLSNQVDELRYVKNDDGTYNVIPFKGGEAMHRIERDNIPEKELDSLFGRDVAEKMRAYEGDVDGNARSLSGQNLEVGGEGMKSYYDKMVPTRLKEIVKKLDKEAKIEMTPVAGTRERVSGADLMRSLPETQGMDDAAKAEWWRNLDQGDRDELFRNYYNNQMEMPSITITPAMREKILSGQTAFAKGGRVKLLQDEYPTKYMPKVGRQVMQDGGRSMIDRALAVVSTSKPGRR